MSDADPILDDIALALTALAGRMDALEKGQEAVAKALHQERDLQRQTLSLLIQFLERQTESLKRIEGKMGEAPAVRRQATIKSQVLLTKPTPKPAPKPVVELKPVPKAKPLPRPPAPVSPAAAVEPEIEQQISEAIGNISAMLKKKEGKRRKGG
ncbi:MAG: hypothetical protein HZA67_07750 [Rhodospirillales bacterium]|jgi:hypothetical protein|nr:hypothetical protein [Rhodospirillales bacterium]